MDKVAELGICLFLGGEDLGVIALREESVEGHVKGVSLCAVQIEAKIVARIAEIVVFLDQSIAGRLQLGAVGKEAVGASACARIDDLERVIVVVLRVFDRDVIRCGEIHDPLLLGYGAYKGVGLRQNAVITGVQLVIKGKEGIECLFQPRVGVGGNDDLFVPDRKAVFVGGKLLGEGVALGAVDLAEQYLVAVDIRGVGIREAYEAGKRD